MAPGIGLRTHCFLFGTETILRKDDVLLDNPNQVLESGHFTTHTHTTSSLKQRHCHLLPDKQFIYTKDQGHTSISQSSSK